jgi:hypothetical protein
VTEQIGQLLIAIKYFYIFLILKMSSLNIRNTNSKINLISNRIKYGTDGGINVDAGALYVNGSNGRVGINTIFPQSNLDVSGSITTNSNISSNGNIDISGYYRVNNTPINNDFYPALSQYSFGTKAVLNWVERTKPNNISWNSVCWSPELSLFVAVANSGTNDRAMTSPDGITWTTQTTNNNSWSAICWGAEAPNGLGGKGLFVAVSVNGTNDRVMTSPDGITWTTQTTNNNTWRSVCWSAELGLFVAVSESGTNDRVMTSPDGINWTTRTSAADNQWFSVCWSSELYLFVAVAISGTGNRVMTSPDGINWTIRTSAADNQWFSVCWSPELSLFVAVASSGNNDRVMISSDGINWTTQTTNNNQWRSVCWSPQLGLFAALSFSGDSNRVMTSPDGINWSGITITFGSSWRGICWSAELGVFVGVATTGIEKIIMSSLKGRPPTSYNVFDSSFNNINELGLWTFQSFGRGVHVTKTTDFAVQPGENWINCNGAGTITVTLPAASQWTGQEIMMKNLSTTQSVNSISSNVVPLGSTVAGSTIFTAGAGSVKFITLVSDGTNWVIMNGN